jgi:Flp pilus assembly protein TadD/peroxiredoxin
LQPIDAPDFSLPDLVGKAWERRSFDGNFLLLGFCSLDSPMCKEQLHLLDQHQSKLSSKTLRVVAIHVDDQIDHAKLRTLAEREKLSFPLLLGTADTAGVYNIVYRYLFDRRRDLLLPTSFLIDKEGMIIKVYQGLFNPEHLLADLDRIPETTAERIPKALPFAGTLYQSVFKRNDFTYGVAFFQHGYLEQAEESFKHVIATKPNDPEAYYNLGTLYLSRKAFEDARHNLERAVTLRSNYPEAWNNLGMLAAQRGHADEALHNFQQSLQLRPNYAVALLNLGNLYRRQRAFDDAEKVLSRALELEPKNPEVHYSLGMLYAQQAQADRAVRYLEDAVKLRPDYPDALNNLGVIFVNEQRYSDAEERFKACIAAAPNFDQAYLNLAHLYALSKDKEKARAVLLALLERQPEHKVARQELEMLQ